MPWSLSPRRGLAAIVLVAAVVTFWPGGAGAATSRPPVRRVLVLSLPGLTWAALDQARVPNLERLLDESAVGSGSVRTIRRHTYPGDGYSTLGAGTSTAGVFDVDGLAFHTDEPFEDGTAGDAYHRRIGRPAAGPIVSLAPHALQRDADRRHRGAEIGSLGDALAAAGVDRAVVGNADEALAGREEHTFHREAVLALADGHGVLPAGEVSRRLLRPDPAGAFGIGLDADTTLAAFRAAWGGAAADRRAVVLLEASDLARVNAYRSLTTGARFRAMFRSALEAADVLVGQVLAQVDPTRDAVVVVAPSDPGDGVHLTVAGLRAPGIEPGLLSSASTRRPGFVMLTDLAPTVLDLLEIERPESMEGRHYETRGPYREAGEAAPVGRFVEADREARFRDRMLAPVATTYVTLQILLSLAAAVVLTREWRDPTPRRALGLVALWLMAVVPLTFLPSVLDIATVGPYLLVVVGGAAVLAGAASLVPRLVARAAGAGGDGPVRARLWPMAGLLGLLLAVQVGDVMTGSHLQIATVFGYSPTVGGRFSGFGNLSFGQVATAAILLAGILARLLGRPWGNRIAVGVLVVALVADGMPIWGSDVGGVLAAVPAFSLVTLRLTGRKVSARRLVALGAAAVGAVTAFGFLDLLRPAPQRTHLGRLFEHMGEDGFRPLTDAIIRKLGENLSVLPTSVWVPLVPSVVAFLAWLAWGRSIRLERLRARAPELRPAFVGVLVAAVLGFALNDSGIAVPAMMLGVLNPVLVYLAVHWDHPEGTASTLTPGATGEAPGAEPQGWAVHEPRTELRVGEPRLP
ncbi:MAG: hypothetical protein AB1679_28110 [Actinomycetota bacterium]